MIFAYQVLVHTPVWVLALLAYLVWQGVQAMQRARRRSGAR